ncbi:cation transport protein-domain-containing protein [Crepidotus variabilis]|uniref:Cation transport protein-domain-containing protein n=1 Tax=Crepidotus variabilis TaxID=179855 RepID=A0A9P6EH41_9AGAR|nr:cation transport protein-domain-containing protein [Crepidotus variabilis]
MNGQASHYAENGVAGPTYDTTKENETPDNLAEGVKESFLRRFFHYLREEITFFRVHLAAFVFIPLIFAGIFYASNGRYHINFLDSMFLCYSAMTVTGLSVVNLSTTTKWQQFILYFLMAIGDITIVSWTMVLIRKRFFRTHCEYIISKRKRRHLRSKKSLLSTISAPIATFKQREPTPRQPTRTPSGPTPHFHVQGPTPGVTRANTYAPDTKNWSKSFEENRIFGGATPLTSSPRSATADLPTIQDLPEEGNSPSPPLKLDIPDEPYNGNQNLLSPPGTQMFSPQSILSVNSEFGIPKPGTRSPQVVEFATSTNVNPHRRGIPNPKRTPTMISNRSLGPPNLPNSPTSLTTNHTEVTHTSKYDNMGGFPGPAALVQSVVRITAPHAYRNFGKIGRKLTMTRSVQTVQGSKVPWLSDITELIIGRNSNFRTDTLTDDQLEQIGGAEYRALRLLSYLIPAYFVVTQLVAVILFLPWLKSTKEYDSVFEAQPRLVDKTWFSFFQVMGAYTGGGLSLVDMQGHVAVPKCLSHDFCIVLGHSRRKSRFTNFSALRDMDDIKDSTAPFEGSSCFNFPARPSSKGRRLSLHSYSYFTKLIFSNRCFMFLFPSHQTWFLVICLLVFSIIEWVCFVTLNIGLPVYEALPTGHKIVEGLFQGLAARASGFAIVPLASLAPALQFLYVVMMYIAVYPVALSIRTTNVYEERSLGIFEAPAEDEDEEPTDGDIGKIQSKKERVGKYVKWHLRRQMSVDIWWLVWAVFVIAIIERKNILDEDKKWFDLFRVLFELVSAFGGIGLSLGLPTDNYSFAGSFSPLSKLVVIVIMVRGRHRGLPVAVDRAVLLPSELVTGSNNNNPPAHSSFHPTTEQTFHEKPVTHAADSDLNINRILHQTMSF